MLNLASWANKLPHPQESLHFEKSAKTLNLSSRNKNDNKF